MDGFKNSTKTNYDTASGRKFARGGMMDEGVSTRPTTASGRRMTNEELGMVPGGMDPAKKKPGQTTEREGRAAAKKKATPKVMSDLERARMMVTRPLARSVGGGVNSKLSSMITQTKANMAAEPRAKSTFVDTMKKVGPQKPSSGNPLMGGMNRGDIVASKHTTLSSPDVDPMVVVGRKPPQQLPPTRGPSMAPAHSDRPMIRRKTGGLTAMPKGKC